eukprot:495863-Prymnesium_polylepis.2
MSWLTTKSIKAKNPAEPWLATIRNMRVRLGGWSTPSFQPFGGTASGAPHFELRGTRLVTATHSQQRLDAAA